MPGRHLEVATIVLTDGKEARSVYCLTMAQYCPLPGQFLAIARQETTRREEEGEATRKKKREKDYSRFYSSLFTKPPETPINTGVPRGEEWRCTLHHSSPLFTSSLSQPPLKTEASHHWRPKLLIIEGWRPKPDSREDLASSKKNQGEERWREVKSAPPLFTAVIIYLQTTYPISVKSEECF